MQRRLGRRNVVPLQSGEGATMRSRETGLVVVRELREAMRGRWFVLASVSFLGLSLGLSLLGLAGAAAVGARGLRPHHGEPAQPGVGVRPAAYVLRRCARDLGRARGRLARAARWRSR